ncbi:MAG: hypothetical protein WBS24_13235 [Terriglobales bacterium]
MNERFWLAKCRFAECWFAKWYVDRASLAAILLALVMPASRAFAQDHAPASSSDSLPQAVRELNVQVRELRAMIAEMRSDSEQARAETRELRRELESLRAEINSPQNVVAKSPSAQGSSASNLSPSPSQQNAPSELPTSTQPDAGAEEPKSSARAASLEETYDLLSGKIDDQYQTKVESASKYRMRISGIVLMNLFSNQGTVDDIDLPMLAYPRPAGSSGGSFGATLRQSEIGFEVFGPRVAGAKTKADLQLDLAGGFPPVPNGSTSGLMRLRTAAMRMDWENTSVIAGQDGIFFSPDSPTSFATLAAPALSYAGNLWGWVPQIRLEHKLALGESSSLLLQGGILDPVSGETPAASSYQQAGPGESSRRPALGTRVAWTRNIFGQPLRIGMGGFYGRQAYGFGRNEDAWAWMSDLGIPLASRFYLSGEIYRGRALGGLYGGFGQSVLFSGSPASSYTEIRALNTVGGWAQLKYRPAAKLEFNAAFGMDNPYAADLEYFSNPQSYGDSTLAKNRAGFANVIYRPRSDLLFSAEYRQIETNAVAAGLSGAGHLNLAMGVLF